MAKKKNNQINGKRVLVSLSHESHAALRAAAYRMTGGNLAELLRRAAAEYAKVTVEVGGHKEQEQPS